MTAPAWPVRRGAMPTTVARLGLVVAVVLGATGCSSADDGAGVATAPASEVAAPDTTDASAAPVPSSPQPPTSTTTLASASASASTTSTTTSTSTTASIDATTSTIDATTSTIDATTSSIAASTSTDAASTSTTTVPAVVGASIGIDSIPYDVEVDIGSSVQVRPITLIRRGTPGGTKVLVVGCIHGNECAGVAIVDHLATMPVPAGVELWLVRSMNPDGQAIGDRQNANLVDLNRNFPERWAPLGAPGDWQYGGPYAASEPETQTMVALGEAVRPDLNIWYHQDLNRINPASGLEGQVRARYAELTGLPLVEITGGTYTGTASQWSRAVAADGGIGFTVELGESIDDAQATAHAIAVVTVADELL